MEFNVASPFEAITGSDVFLDGSLPYPTATVSSVALHNTTSQSNDVLTSVTSSTGQQTQHVGSVGYNGGISTIATVTHTVSRPVDTTAYPGISMNLNLPGSRPPASYCCFTLPASANNPMPWSRPPWPQIYPYSGFPGQAFPGFWPFGGNIEPVATSVVGPQTVISSLSAPAPHVAVSSSCDVSLPAPVPTSSVRPQVNQVSDWPLSGWV
jgi:hypothetical protein